MTLIQTFYKNFYLIEFAEIIKELLNVKSEIQHLNGVEDDPTRRKPDISRAKKVLDWEPKVPLKKGLQLTIEYFRTELETQQLDVEHLDAL